MIAAMESTSTCFMPPFCCLDEVMPGRNTDAGSEVDRAAAQVWLLSRSFVSPPPIRRLEVLAGYR
jgi:hypothetical protein